MGGCHSDVRGGQQAVGGGQRSAGNAVTNSNDAAHNDAVDFFFRSHGLQGLFTQVELSLSASKLLDRDITSKSDPMVVVFIKKNGALQEIGRTEVILNNLNPQWIEKVSVAFHFETVQPLVFRVYDIDTKYYNVPVKTIRLSDQDFLGEASCVLSEILTKQNRSLTLCLKDGHGGSTNLGSLTVRAEETVASRSVIELVLRCSHLDNKDVFSKSDPFLRISRVVESGGSIPICKTEVVKDNLNPDNPLVIECFDFNSNGSHELIGKLQKSMADLEKLYSEKSGANFVIPSSSRGGYEKKTQFSFLDYISSGFQLNFMVAVDFTASNGNPYTPDSLHYIDHTGRLNSYQQAIMEVGEVIQFYDADRRFPAWGFGARTLDGNVSHCFNLSEIPTQPEVEGVEGIMGAYANALHNVRLAGPTLFGQVINKAADIAAHSLFASTNKYFVLLIITDGVLTDLQETTEALVRASDLPLSILIVGVGRADFKQMEVLDADNGQRLESSTGRVATRDIVQFVSMREIHSGATCLVEALLEELPDQFLSYMRNRDIKPIPLH
ncbi:Protein BONZAI 3, partial [Cucurbita argyrosperma subsp. sororia]